MAPKKKRKTGTPAAKSPDAGNSTPQPAGGRAPPRPRGTDSAVQEEAERPAAQTRAVGNAASTLPEGSGGSQLSGVSDLTDEELLVGADFLHIVKQKLGKVTTQGLVRVMAGGIIAAAEHDRPATRPSSVVRPASDSPAPDVICTGRSTSVHVQPSAAEIASIGAGFISGRLAFCDRAAVYESYPTTDPCHITAENELVRHLRTALLDAAPNAATLSYVLGHLAQAAAFLLGPHVGERVCALIHGQSLSLGTALAAVGSRLGETVDADAISRLLCKETLRHLTLDGTDPAVYVRQRLLELSIDAEKRLVKRVLNASAVPQPQAQPLSFTPMSPYPNLPPGLGYGSHKPPLPPMVGLPGQNISDRLNRWIRSPRDANRIVNMSACMLCGKGSTPNSAGHRSGKCTATEQEQAQWIQQAIPVQ